VQQLLTDCMNLVHTAYPTLSKYSLQKRGLPISRYTRRQVEPLTPELMQRLDELLEKVSRVEADLGIEPAQAGGSVRSAT
jgi:4-hydroxy-tetrahydrodipicolinate synthase